MSGLIKIAAIVLLSAAVSWAQPYLVSDPQCKDGCTNCSDGVHGCAAGFEISFDAGANWQTAGSMDVGTDEIRLSHDLVGTAAGDHSIQVRAVNAWGDSAPIPFDFTAGAPSALNGLRIDHQP